MASLLANLERGTFLLTETALLLVPCFAFVFGMLTLATEPGTCALNSAMVVCFGWLCLARGILVDQRRGDVSAYVGNMLGLIGLVFFVLALSYDSTGRCNPDVFFAPIKYAGVGTAVAASTNVACNLLLWFCCKQEQEKEAARPPAVFDNDHGPHIVVAEPEP